MAEDKPTFIERLGKAARSRVAAGTAAVSIGLGAIIGGDKPQQTQSENKPFTTPTPLVLETPKQADFEYDKRIKTLKSVPGNEQAMVWPNLLNVDSPQELNKDQESISKNRELIKQRANLNPRDVGPDGVTLKPSDITVEFSKEPQPTYRFFNGKIQSEDKNNPSVLLDSSGRFKNHQGLNEIINSIPFMSRQNLGYSDFNSWEDFHIVGVPSDVIPEGGYVMVFSRPIADATTISPRKELTEKPNAKYDIWELDTAVYSDTAKISSAEKKLSKKVQYFIIDAQDRTDRLTPFYNKDNPAWVQKAMVVFDAKGKAVGKIFLDAKKFSPRQEWMDTYQGNPALINPDYVAPKGGEAIQFSNFLKKMWVIRSEFGDKEFILNVDESGVEAGSPYLFTGDERLGEKTPAVLELNVQDPKQSRLTLGFSLHLTKGQYDDFRKNWWGLKPKAPAYPNDPYTVDIPIGTQMRVKVDGEKLTLQEIILPKSN